MTLKRANYARLYKSLKKLTKKYTSSQSSQLAIFPNEHNISNILPNLAYQKNINSNSMCIEFSNYKK